jgi:hypothetical protein
VSRIFREDAFRRQEVIDENTVTEARPDTRERRKFFYPYFCSYYINTASQGPMYSHAKFWKILETRTVAAKWDENSARFTHALIR